MMYMYVLILKLKLTNKQHTKADEKVMALRVMRRIFFA